MSEVIRFLLIYDHHLNRLIEPPRTFPGDAHARDAFDAYDQAEIDYADQRDRYEVLLVGSESLDSVKATHGRFFPPQGARDSDVLAGA